MPKFCYICSTFIHLIFYIMSDVKSKPIYRVIEVRFFFEPKFQSFRTTKIICELISGKKYSKTSVVDDEKLFRKMYSIKMSPLAVRDILERNHLSDKITDKFPGDSKRISINVESVFVIYPSSLDIPLSENVVVIRNLISKGVTFHDIVRTPVLSDERKSLLLDSIQTDFLPDGYISLDDVQESK